MRKLSIRERVLLICLVLIAAASAYVLLFYMPMSQRETELTGQIAQSETLSAQLEARLEEQRQMERTLEELSARDDAPGYMPAYDNLQSVMVELNAILEPCQEYSLSFQGEQTDEHLFCRRVTIPFTCGDYVQAKAILQRLHDSPLRGLLQDIQLTQQEDGAVRVTAVMVFYEYQENGTQSE